MKIIWLFVCIAIGEAIGARLKRASGGEPISIEDAPYAVLLKREWKRVCSGALISNRHVLTAAQCVVDGSFNRLNTTRVVIGTDKNDLTDYGCRIEDIFPHKGFRKRPLSCNIAVIKLLHDIDESPKQKEIALPNTEMPNWKYATLTAFDFGWAANPNSGLQKLRVKKINPTIPSKDMDDDDNVFYGTISNGASTNDNDCGAPLTYNNTIIGIALMVRPRNPRANYYVNVVKFKTFIEESMGLHTSPNSQRPSVIVWGPKRPRTY